MVYKLVILLEREQYAEDTRSLAHEHANQWEKLAEWVRVKEAYLNRREPIESISDVTTQIAFLEAYKAEKKLVKTGEVADLKALGKKLLDRARNTDLSTYTYEHTKYLEPTFDEDKPETRQLILDHEKWVDDKRAELKKAYHAKKAVLEDHLKREEFASDTRTLGQTHGDMFNKLAAWANAKHAFLLAREKIDSIALAQTHLTLLDQYLRYYIFFLCI